MIKKGPKIHLQTQLLSLIFSHEFGLLLFSRVLLLSRFIDRLWGVSGQCLHASRWGFAIDLTRCSEHKPCSTEKRRHKHSSSRQGMLVWGDTSRTLWENRVKSETRSRSTNAFFLIMYFLLRGCKELYKIASKVTPIQRTLHPFSLSLVFLSKRIYTDFLVSTFVLRLLVIIISISLIHFQSCLSIHRNFKP